MSQQDCKKHPAHLMPLQARGGGLEGSALPAKPLQYAIWTSTTKTEGNTRIIRCLEVCLLLKVFVGLWFLYSVIVCVGIWHRSFIALSVRESILLFAIYVLNSTFNITWKIIILSKDEASMRTAHQTRTRTALRICAKHAPRRFLLDDRRRLMTT